MRVLVVSEGNHELGNDKQVGALPTIVLRLMGESVEIARERAGSDRVRVHWRPGKGRGFEKRGLAWIRYAEREGFDALVFLVDEDGDRLRRADVEACQANPHFSLRRAMGVAVRTFDAWMLADERAATTVLGIEIQRQKDPEAMPSPKSICESLRDDAGSDLSLTALYQAIAERLDFDQLALRCVAGFAPFLDRCQKLRVAKT